MVSNPTRMRPAWMNLRGPRSPCFRETLMVYGVSGGPLWTKEVRQLILTGIEIDATVVKNARDAFDRGLSVLAGPRLLAVPPGLSLERDERSEKEGSRGRDEIRYA